LAHPLRSSVWFYKIIINLENLCNLWQKLRMKKSLEQITREDGRYNPEAVKFVSYTISKITSEHHHVGGQTLCEELKKLAAEKWGRLAMSVLSTWGVKTTRDFGEIVYLLIKNEWLTAQPTDSIDDFNDVYDFKTIFKDQFEF